MKSAKVIISKKFEQSEQLELFLNSEVEIERSDMIEDADHILLQCINDDGYMVKHDLKWGEVYENLSSYALEVCMNNFDGFYLEQGMNDIKENAYENIIVGSSYPSMGMEEKMFELKTKNLALRSQDFFYSNAILSEAAENRSIKNVILGVGYWCFFHDISRSQNMFELSQIPKVYFPIFNNSHNATMLPENIPLRTSDIWNIENIINWKKKKVYKAIDGNYFFQGRQRDVLVGSWSSLNENEKKDAGARRGNEHNRLIRYKESFEENIQILKNMIKTCEKNNWTFYICVMPASEQYRATFSGDFKRHFYDTLESMEGTIHLIDLFECDEFGNADFHDSDHLSEKGAIKLTYILRETFGI